MIFDTAMDSKTQHHEHKGQQQKIDKLDFFKIKKERIFFLF